MPGQTTIIEPDPETMRQFLKEMQAAPTIVRNSIPVAATRAVKVGRATLIGLLWRKLNLRWRTILQARVKYEPYRGDSAYLNILENPITPTSFKGNYSGGNYNLQVQKNGWTVVVPAAFKGKGLDGKLHIFERTGEKRRQIAGHYKPNIGKMRRIVHAAAPIGMWEILQKFPVSGPVQQSIQKAFDKQIEKIWNGVHGKPGDDNE